MSTLGFVFCLSLLYSTLFLGSHQIGITIGNLTLLTTNSLIATDHIYPVAASMGSTMIAVWQSKNLIGTSYSLSYSLYTLGLWAPPLPIVNTNDVSQPFITSSSTTYYLAYVTSSETIQLLTTVTGSVWTLPITFPRGSLTASKNQHPSLAIDEVNNRLVLVWDGQVNGLSQFDILFSTSDDGGMTWSDTVILNSNARLSSFSNVNPFVLCTSPNHWIVVWASNDPINGTGTDFDIFYSRSLDGGRSWSSTSFLNTNAQIDQGDDLHPRLASLNTNLIAIWSSNDKTLSGNTQGTDFDIFVSYSQDNGNTWLPVNVLNTNAAVDDGDDLDPRIITNPWNGYSVAVWVSNSTLFSSSRLSQALLIYSLQSNNEPFVWTFPDILNPNTRNISTFFIEANPSLLLTPNGDFLTLWNSNITHFLGQSLVGQNIFALDYKPIDIIVPSTFSNSTSSPSFPPPLPPLPPPTLTAELSPFPFSSPLFSSPAFIPTNTNNSTVLVSPPAQVESWIIALIVVSVGVLVLVAILVVIFRIRALKPKQNQTKQPPPDLNQVDLTLHYLASKYANDRLSTSQSASNKEQKDENFFPPKETNML